jgi:hypothetical protein
MRNPPLRDDQGRLPQRERGGEPVVVAELDERFDDLVRCVLFDHLRQDLAERIAGLVGNFYGDRPELLYVPLKDRSQPNLGLRLALRETGQEGQTMASPVGSLFQKGAPARILLDHALYFTHSA